MPNLGLAEWIAAASAMAAWIAALCAVVSIRVLRQEAMLAKGNELRRQPSLTLYLIDGFTRPGPTTGSRLYAFRVSIANPSDSDNSVALIDLRITYRAPNGVLTAVMIPLATDDKWSLSGPSQTVLSPPIRVDAHQSVAGWAYFAVDPGLLQDCEIDGYEVVLTDSHSKREALRLSLIRELADESQVAEETSKP